MKRTSRFITAFIFLIFSQLIFNNCSDRPDTVSCFPRVQINVLVNISLPIYQKLQYDGGWVYVNEVGSGTRGLIIVRASAGFKVYDRNAPHLCPDSNTTLEVKNETKIYCPKDGAEWILITGQPLKVDGAEKTSVPPKTYPHSFDPATGVISIYY